MSQFDLTTIRQYEDYEIAICIRYDYDEKLTHSFFAPIEWKQVRAMRRSRIIVESAIVLTA